MSLGQQWDRKLPVTKSTCKFYFWVVCAWTLPFYQGIWCARVCANPTPVFPCKKASSHCVQLGFGTVGLCRSRSKNRSNISYSESLNISMVFLALVKKKNLNCFMHELKDNVVGKIWSWNALFWWLIQVRDSLQKLEKLSNCTATIVGKYRNPIIFKSWFTVPHSAQRNNWMTRL